MAKKPLEIDMIAGSQLKDTQGEMLSVEGADISDLASGNGRLNDNHGKGFFNSIGRVTKAKKVFKEEDCDDDRERYYWDKIKAPFIYVKGLLYDDEDHPNAKAAAAILRNIHKSDIPLKLKASVEGGVISRGIKDTSLLARTKIHSVALTFTPANNATLVEPISLDKSIRNEAADMELIKSVMHLAQTNVPSFRHIVRDAKAQRVYDNLCKISDMFSEQGIFLSNIPTKEEILKKSLEAKVSNNIKKIHAMVKDLDEEELNKSVKSALAAGAMAAGLAVSPAQAKQPRAVASIEQHKHAANPLLDAISMVESSGGKNLNHKTITDKHSMHYGHTAGGKYAMMPLSAQYTLRNDPALAKKYPDLVKAASDIKNHHREFTDRFNRDPQAAEDFAQSFYNRTKSKVKTPEMIIHAWNHGLKGTWNKYKRDPESIKNDEYVKAVQDAMKRLHKALTAGYGGAGAPTGRSGGSVLQAESVDDGRGLKYISCDKCGKEQVHMKHQVKCRHCSDNFSLKKLYENLHKSDYVQLKSFLPKHIANNLSTAKLGTPEREAATTAALGWHDMVHNALIADNPHLKHAFSEDMHPRTLGYSGGDIRSTESLDKLMRTWGAKYTL
jgi:hypothetical protein